MTSAPPTMPAAAEIRSAAALVVRYQPIVDLRTGQIRGAEALARAAHPTLGLLAPDRFMPEDCELWAMRELTAAILDEAFGAAVQLRRRCPDIRVHVNIPPWMLETDWLLDAVISASEFAGAPPSALVVEVLETGVVNGQASRAVLQGLRLLGVDVALDDFGRGFATLQELADLDADILKLDMGLIKVLGDVGQDPEYTEAAMAIADAQSKGITVIAEGVERQRQIDSLRWLRCPLAQGYLLGRPVTRDQLLRCLS